MTHKEVTPKDEDKKENVISQNQALKIDNLGLTELNDEELKDVQQKKEIYKTNAKEKKKNEIPIIREPSTREKKKREILDL